MISAIIKQFGKLWILDILNENLYPISIISPNYSIIQLVNWFLGVVWWRSENVDQQCYQLINNYWHWTSSTSSVTIDIHFNCFRGHSHGWFALFLLFFFWKHHKCKICFWSNIRLSKQLIFSIFDSFVFNSNKTCRERKIVSKIS